MIFGIGPSVSLCNYKHTKYFSISYARDMKLVTCKHCIKMIYEAKKEIADTIVMSKPFKDTMGKKIPETIEVDNETRRTILVTACRSKITGKLYIHIGHAHGNETRVKPIDYSIIKVNEIED